MAILSPRTQRMMNLTAALGVASLTGALAASEPTTTLVSVGTGGVLPECGDALNFCYSVDPDITPDGRYVAFRSVVHNITDPPYTSSGNITQILVHDRHTCTTTRISETPGGEPANYPCENPSMSADGQIIAFRSTATNLAPGVTLGTDQIYIYDAATNSVELISKSPNGLFSGNGPSAVPEISDDGRWLVFQSAASNLVPNDTNGQPDIFLYDRQSDSITRVNVNDGGDQLNGPSRRPSISSNGRYIVFDTSASNLVEATFSLPQVFVIDRDGDADGTYDEPGDRTLTLVSVNDNGDPANGFASWGVISPDGRLVAFSGGNTVTNLVPGDTNGATDVFVRNLETGTTTRESVGPNGEQTFAGSYFPFTFSADGQYLTFHSPAQDLVEGGHNGFTHIIRRDLESGENLIISRTSEGDLANNSSEVGIITPNGNTVVFTSAASNIRPDLQNDDWVNIYVRSLRPADLTGDGSVNVFDLLFLLGNWGDGSCSISDLTGDGQVNVFDLLDLLGDWG